MMAEIMKNLEALQAKKANATTTTTTPAASTTTTTTTAAPATPAGGETLKSDEIFGMMATYLNQGEGKPLIEKVAAIFGFEITKTKGGKVLASYAIDLKNG
jgi:hypothetical protein